MERMTKEEGMTPEEYIAMVEEEKKSELELLKKENEELRKELELAELRAENAELRRKLMAKQFPYNPYYNGTITLLNDTDSNIVLC